MGGIRTDLSFAVRQLLRAPGFGVLAVLALAIGIGATTTVFSIVNAVLLRPLPYPNADRLVRLFETSPQGSSFSVSEANFLDFRQRSRSFTELAAVRRTFLTLLGGADGADPPNTTSNRRRPGHHAPERVVTVETTAGLFAALGVRPDLGRTFQPGEDSPGADTAVAVLSHGLWQRSFGADPAIVGRTLRFDGADRTVVGVMPEGMTFPFGAELWIPLAPDPAFPRDDHRLEAFGLLEPGVSLEAARSELSTIAAKLADEYPETNTGWGTQLVTFNDWLIGPGVARTNLVLLGAVTLLLLLACANVSNLLLARATVRQQEMSVRSALGADRWRLVRQMLTEGLVLGVLGAGAGVPLALAMVSFLRSLEFRALPRLEEVTVDASALVFTLLVTLLATLLFGLAPALQTWTGALGGALRRSHWTASDRTARLRDGLVVVEVAIAMMLLLGSVLLLRSFLRMQEIDPGFSPDRVLAVNIALPDSRYGELTPETNLFFSDVLAAIESSPGVVAAGATMVDPFSGLRPANFVTPSDRPATPENVVPIQWRCVTPGYFRAVGVPLRAGRLFDSTDRFQVSPFAGGEVPRLDVVISSSLAELLWGDEDSVGRELRWGGTSDGMPLHVLGVVGDIQDVRLTQAPQPVVFVSHDQVPWPQMTLVVRAADDPATVAAGVREAIREVDPSLAVAAMRPLVDSFTAAVAGPRFNALILGGFACAALALACIGVYAVMSFSVARRTREIAVRIALGATPGALVGVVLRRAMLLAGAGIAVGCLLALASNRLLSALLYGIPATHAATYGGVALILATATAVAALLPAYRATRVDPAHAIRAE